MQPSPKDSEMDELIVSIMGKSRIATIQSGKCMTCDTVSATDYFRDQLSRKEYTISGMCQRCQDKVFGISED